LNKKYINNGVSGKKRIDTEIRKTLQIHKTKCWLIQFFWAEKLRISQQKLVGPFLGSFEFVRKGVQWRASGQLSAFIFPCQVNFHRSLSCFNLSFTHLISFSRFKLAFPLGKAAGTAPRGGWTYHYSAQQPLPTLHSHLTLYRALGRICVGTAGLISPTFLKASRTHGPTTTAVIFLVGKVVLHSGINKLHNYMVNTYAVKSP